MTRAGAVALALGLAIPGLLQAQMQSLRPEPRPEPRPEIAPAHAHAAGAPRPAPRPENLRRRHAVRAAGFQPATPPLPNVFRRGALCGDRRLAGQAAPVIPARLPGCGLSGGVTITAVDGIPLSTPSHMDCRTAQTLAYWVNKVLRPTVGRLGGGVSEIQVAGHYVCRTRNHRPNAPISEHGKGKAIDISGFRLRNGARISVLRGWNDPEQGAILRRVHRGACGPFGTVLGPNANRLHRDHFHFDTARHGSGSYCR